ncbi:MAG: hypothetical protein K9J13_14170 [Saprospiraceae bacterium]|nr:hypothetical protein [Saprospiraceae bacterium]
MKTKILLLALISIVIISCNKKEDDEDPIETPKPILSLRFGHIGNFYDFIPFTNQASIEVDSIAANNEFGISIAETDLPDVGDLTTDKLIFKFDITTKDDIEHFDNKLNISSSSAYVVTFGSKSEIGGDFGLPYQFSSIAIPGNDTIEINNLGDSISVNYVSSHSSLTGKISAVITP